MRDERIPFAGIGAVWWGITPAAGAAFAFALVFVFKRRKAAKSSKTIDT
jgi:hypothetical protein